MITNELWTLDVKESDDLVTMMKRFFDLVRVSGHTDAFSLMQVFIFSKFSFHLECRRVDLVRATFFLTEQC
jgi:hypothetical protein